MTRTQCIAAVLLSQMLLSGASIADSSATVKQLMQKDLVSDPSKEAVMVTVEYGPGGASLPHRHDAQVFVYVLEGNLTMQVKGSAPVSLHPGDTFYEGPEDIHLVSANSSKTAPAKILVFIVKTKGAAASRPAS
ncbi:MAG TPA: cupin domain-containing protein [Steroidobacteraceae bacterium]|jgi:quercetin dioxygenase-like cupin family protein